MKKDGEAPLEIILEKFALGKDDTKLIAEIRRGHILIARDSDTLRAYVVNCKEEDDITRQFTIDMLHTPLIGGASYGYHTSCTPELFFISHSVKYGPIPYPVLDMIGALMMKEIRSKRMHEEEFYEICVQGRPTEEQRKRWEECGYFFDNKR